MTDSWWPRPARPGRVEGDPDRVAFLVPGHGYSAERPLLHFAQAVFARHGWTTENVWWTEPPPARDGQDHAAWYERLRTFAIAQVGPVLDAERAPRIALVGKSLGTLTAALAARRGLPAVWLTPVLRDSRLGDDLRRCTAPYLLVGSNADRSWDGALARELGGPILEADGADHGLETPDDPVNSAAILQRVTAAMDDFVASL
jgi:hypothetical protein